LEFAAEYGRPRPFRRCVRLKSRELAAELRIERREARNGCLADQRADPIEFAEDFPGPRPVRQCIRQELI
jgi:hypothetical protein